MFKGSITALITPFTQSGEIDWSAYDNFVEWQIDQGIHGVVPCGTTGESPTLTHDEHKKLVKRCVEIVDKRVPVIAGTGSNNTREALELTQEAKDDGADGALIVTPYYNKPTQEGLYQHYKAINDSVDIPVIVYNIPGRSVVDISLETMARLSELKNIVGLKDASADLERPLILRNMIGDDFCQLTGENSTYTAFLAQGGHGGILVTSNIAPKMCADLFNAWENNDLKEIARCRDALSFLHKDLFMEPSPAPVKYVANQLGLCENNLRLPLLPATPACEDVLKTSMKHAGLVAANSAPIKAHG